MLQNWARPSRVPPPDQNLMALPSAIYNEIVKEINLNNDNIQNLIACADGTEYELNAFQRSEVLPNTPNHGQFYTQAYKLLEIWADKGMRVGELANALRLFKMEKSLLLLVQPEPLQLKRDVIEGVELTEGDTLELSCEASGLPFPRYTWFKSDTPVTRNRTGVLVIENIGLNNSGLYTCRIHNPTKEGTLFTQWCKVYVKERTIVPQPAREPTPPIRLLKIPVITKDLPRERSVRYKDTLELSFEVQPSSSPLQFCWYKDNQLIQPGGTTLEPRLVIANFETLNGGIYYCQVANDFGQCKTGECKVKTNFNTMPNIEIKHQPQDMLQCCLHGVAVFKVEAVHDEPLKYQWMYNRNDIPNECEPELQVILNKKELKGIYTCRVYSGTSSTLTRDAELTILDPRHPCQTYTATDKVALILGESSYRSNCKPLPAVKNDIYEAYKVLTSLKFKTLAFLDSSLEELKAAVELLCDFMESKGNNELYVVLYVLGHGFIYHGNHYLMPHNALEGRQVSNCLMIEEVERKISHDLDPALLFMVVDLCKKEMERTVPEVLPQPSMLPLSKKRVAFYAATRGEESCEEEVKDVVGPKSNKHLVRGIFCRHFLEILCENPKLKCREIFPKFRDDFKAPDPLVVKREMTPDIHFNLHEYNRSLGDSINTEGQEVQYQERLKRWESMNMVPSSLSVEIIKGLWHIQVSFHQRGSNILEMSLTEFDQRPPNSALKYVEFRLQKEAVPPHIRPVEEIPCVDRRIKRYLFFNLQRLQAELTVLIFVDVYQKNHEQCLHQSIPVHMGLPLIRSTWPKNLAHDAASLEPDPRRIPCVQEEELSHNSMGSESEYSQI